MPRGTLFFGTAIFLSVLLLLAATLSPAFAAWYGRGAGAFFRRVFAGVTAPFPFSVAELALFLLPFAIFSFVWSVLSSDRTKKERIFTVLSAVLILFAFLFSTFAFLFGAGYHTVPLDEELSLPRDEVTAEKLYQTALYLTDRTNEAALGVAFGEDGFSKMPYSFGEMNEKLVRAYGILHEEYAFVSASGAGAKPLVAGKLLSYMHVTGVYTFFTGEANVNMDFPDFTIPYTAAHEMAHQRGVAREEEANFVAFLALEKTDDAYLLYSGCFALLEYTVSALARENAEHARDVLSRLSPEVLREWRAYGAFFAKYRDSAAAKVSDGVNDVFLKSQGNRAGNASYGLVVRLAVAYFQNQTDARE